MAKSDLIETYCKGKKEDFGGKACHNYDQSENECELLKTGRLQRIFEKGRCQPAEFVKKIVRKHLRKYEHVYDDAETPEKRREDLEKHAQANAFLITEQHLKAKENWEANYTLPGLMSYLETTVPHRLTEILQEEQEIPERKCRECMYLSPQKPYKCKRETIMITFRGREHERSHPFYGQERRPSARACRQGFQPLAFPPTEDTDSFSTQDHLDIPDDKIETDKRETDMFPATPEEAVRLGFVLKDAFRLLAKRFIQATGEQQKIYQRHHFVFVRMAQLRFEGVERSRAVAIIANELGKSIKQIKDRDLPAIKQFLQEHDVLPG